MKPDKKRYFPWQRVLPVFGLCFCLTACSPEQLAGYLREEAELGQENFELLPEDGGVSAKELEEKASTPSETVQQLQSRETESFYYSRLDAEEQALYGEILYILQERAQEVQITTSDAERIDKVFRCVMNDHPEIFYVEGYNVTRYTLGEEVRMLTFSGTYSMTPETIASNQEKIDSYVNQCFQELLSGAASDYEIVKYIYEYVIGHTEYDAQSPDNQNICSVFIHNKSVCQGYAKATQYLLKQAGINAALIMGTVQNGEGHAWNLVYLDGEAYFVDTTWGDASYQMVEGSSQMMSSSIPPINYDYLCVTSQQLTKTHTIEELVPVPECTSMKDNYYVREGLYFDSADEDKIAEVFARAYESGSSYVTLKCSSREVYEEIRTLLIEKQKIFHYLSRNEGTVSYAENPEQLDLSFWL